MVLVSIVPFAGRRILLLAAAFSAFSIASCFADSLLVTAKKTPYDHQMARIQPVLDAPTSVQHSVLPLSLVNQWMGELRAIPSCYSMEWKTHTCHITPMPAAESIAPLPQRRCTHDCNSNQSTSLRLRY